MRERGWGFSKLNQLDIHTRVPPHGYMIVSRVGAHRFHSRGRLLLLVLSLPFSRTQSSKRHSRTQSDEEFEYTSEEEECCRSAKKRKKRIERRTLENESRGGACK